MKVKVIRGYVDRYTKDLHQPGEVVEYKDKARVKELSKQGFVEEIRETKK